MRKFIGLTFALIFCGRAFAQRFNTDAVNGFWRVVDQLEADRPLTDSLWNAYYNLYGNKVYIQHNRSDEQAAEHRKYLGFVFRPSMADSLAKASDSTTSGYVFRVIDRLRI